MKHKILQLNQLTRPSNQVILMGISTLLLILLAYKPVTKFKNFDPAPGVIKISTDQKNSKVIDAGLSIKNFLNFDILKNDFTIDGILWFAFNPAKISLDEIKKFSFGKAEILNEDIESFGPQIKKINDSKSIAQFDVQVKFSSNLNYKMFPLDNHRLYLTLNNKFLNPEEVLLESSDQKFNVSDNIYTFGWKKNGQYVDSGYTSTVLESGTDKKELKYPRVVFAIDFIGTSIRDILLILLPLFIVFFLGLFAFSFDLKESSSTIMTIAAAVVPALLGYRFVIESMSPKVSYFMFSDYVFTILLILSFILFFLNTFYLKAVQKYKGLILLCFHITIVMSWAYLLYFWA